MARIIDERGRLFGRVSLVDLFVGLVLIVAVVVVVRAYRLTAAQKPPAPTAWLTVTVYAPNVLAQVERLMNSHREERNLEGEVIARIERILQRESVRKLQLGEDGLVRVVEDGRSHNLLLELKVLAQRQPDGYFFKSRKVKAGVEIVFEPAEYIVSGTIVGMELSDPSRMGGAG